MFTYVASPSQSGSNSYRRVCSNSKCGGVFYVSYNASGYRCPHCNFTQQTIRREGETMLDAQVVEAELRRDLGVTIIKELGGFGWVVEVKIDDVPVPARVAVSGQISEEFVMFWAGVEPEHVPEAFMACRGISNVGIASDGGDGYDFRAAIFKRNSLPSAVRSSLRSVAAASLRYQISVLSGEYSSQESPA